MDIYKQKSLIGLFKSEDLKNIPANYLLFERVNNEGNFNANIYRFTECTEFNSAKYLVGNFYKPISKIIEFV